MNLEDEGTSSVEGFQARPGESPPGASRGYRRYTAYVQALTMVWCCRMSDAFFFRLSIHCPCMQQPLQQHKLGAGCITGGCGSATGAGSHAFKASGKLPGLLIQTQSQRLATTTWLHVTSSCSIPAIPAAAFQDWYSLEHEQLAGLPSSLVDGPRQSVANRTECFLIDACPASPDHPAWLGASRKGTANKRLEVICRPAINVCSPREPKLLLLLQLHQDGLRCLVHSALIRRVLQACVAAPVHGTQRRCSCVDHQIAETHISVDVAKVVRPLGDTISTASRSINTVAQNVLDLQVEQRCSDCNCVHKTCPVSLSL